MPPGLRLILLNLRTFLRRQDVAFSDRGDGQCPTKLRQCLSPTWCESTTRLDRWIGVLKSSTGTARTASSPGNGYSVTQVH
jgi:hypothetical protein